MGKEEGRDMPPSKLWLERGRVSWTWGRGRIGMRGIEISEFFSGLVIFPQGLGDKDG